MASEVGSENTDEPRARVNKVVFFGSAIGVLAIALWAMIDKASADAVITAMVTWIGKNLGWFYTLLVVSVFVFVIFIAASKVGKTKLGPDHSRPTFSFFTWASMLFAAGIGIDLMFFSVAEPVTQFLAPPRGDGGTAEAARQALVWTLFHYGLLGWGLYALVGMALGYFAYRHNLPLSIRSALFPIFGKRINGAIGHGVDIAAVLGTIFGIATSLGIGVAQLNYGLFFIFGIPESTAWKIALIALSVVMATISVLTGVEKGIRRLSELNVILCVLLMGYILITGKTAFLLDALVGNVGDMISRFPGMALDTFAFDRPDAWLNSWTLFFWAWWIAWAPFVGLFLARISRGRTIRQFVTAVLVVPMAFILVWISLFGNSAIALVIDGNTAFGEIAMNYPERAFYSLLEQYPAVPLLAGIATFTGMLFYVTSADSGALVMANFTSHLKDPEADGSKPVRLFGSLAIGVLTLAMLLVGGVPTLQGATVIMGLPFSVVLIFLMMGLYKSLRIETALSKSQDQSLLQMISSRSGSTLDWRQRLSRQLTQPNRAQTERYINQVVKPALKEVQQEFLSQGVKAELHVKTVGELQLESVDLIATTHRDHRPFKYHVYPVRLGKPTFALNAGTASSYYRLEAFCQEGSHGLDLLGLTQEQLIADVLDKYETHMAFLRHQSEVDGLSQINEGGSTKLDWSRDFDTAAIPAVPMPQRTVTERRISADSAAFEDQRVSENQRVSEDHQPLKEKS
ncbi:choline BCCT transporter BetT [Neomicrococcus aestuarii]|nr:choline BCCT transporter BetT [Neomicrococcus aestuarii]